MICNKCSSNRATIHIIDIKPEGIRDLHVCEECAKKRGFIPEISSNIDELLRMIGEEQVLGEPNSENNVEDDSPKCPQCAFSAKDISRSSKFGCEEDVALFRNEIKPVLMKIHNATKHTGRSASFCSDNSRKQQALQAFENQLADALKSEDYELAARLRDKIKGLK